MDDVNVGKMVVYDNEIVEVEKISICGDVKTCSVRYSNGRTVHDIPVIDLSEVKQDA